MYPKYRDVHISPDKWIRNILVASVVIALFFVILDSLQQLVKTLYLGETVRSIYSIKYEDSIGTWYSILLALMTACAALLCFLEQYESNRRRALGWFIIAAFFVYISIDDQVTLHEQFGFVFEKSVAPRLMVGTFRLPSYGWQFVYGPFFGMMGIFILFFSFRVLSAKSGKKMVSVSLLLYTLAVLLDFWEGSDLLFSAFYEAVGFDEHSALHWFRIVEESCEMAGTIIFTNAFLRHLEERLSLHPRRFILTSISGRQP
jgi:hypothetical protein